MILEKLVEDYNSKLPQTDRIFHEKDISCYIWNYFADNRVKSHKEFKDLITQILTKIK